MSALRKITRLLVKTLKYAFILIILLFVFLLIAINTESFQTWAAHQAGAFLSKELDARVSIGKVRMAFVTVAEFEDVFIEDIKDDTLLYSKFINVKFSEFSYSKKHLRIESAELLNAKVKIIKYKGDSTFNFQHIVDYFSSSGTSSPSSPWDVKYRKLVLDEIDFVFRNENNDITVSQNINYNNIDLKNLSASFSNINIIHDSIYARVSGLRCEEQSGFALKNLNTTFKIGPKNLMCKNLVIETPESIIKGGFSFRYESWGDYSDFVNKVKIKSYLTDDTKLNTKDIACFVKELNGLDKIVSVNGKINGYINDIKVSKFKFQYGNHTKFAGNFSLKGLPNINNTYISSDVKELSFSKSDLEKIPLYPFTNNKFISLPAEIGKLGVINYKGKFAGYITDFKSYGTFNTALGNVFTDVSMHIDTVKKITKYSGLVKAEQFNVGKLIGNNKLGVVSLQADIKGQGFTIKNIDAEFNGNVYALAYNNYTYNGIELKGTLHHHLFIGDLLSKDPNANFDFSGKIDFSHEIPEMDFISTINKLDLKKLNFTKDVCEISTQLFTNLKGDNLNNLSGEINLDNTLYRNSEKQYKLSTFDLTLDQVNIDKKIKLTSNYFNFTAEGRFNITNLDPAFNQFLNTYYPAFIPKYKTKVSYVDAFKFKLTVKKFNTIRELFVKDLMVSTNSIIEGDFDAAKNLLNFNLKSDSVRYGSIKFNNNTIKSFSQNNKINLVLNGDNIQLSDSIKLNNYFAYFVSKDQNTKFNFEWDNKLTPKNAGKFFGKVLFKDEKAIFTYEKVFLTTKDSTWNLTLSDTTFIDSSGVVVVRPLLFQNNDQTIGIRGGLSNRPDEKLGLYLTNFNLEQLSPFFGSALKIDGLIDGNIALHNTFKNLAFSSDLSFKKLKLNNKELGEGILKAEYNSEDKYLYLDGYTTLGIINPDGEKVKNISFNGYYYMNKKEESLDITFAAKPLSLTLLNPLLTGILTFNTAYVTGEGKVNGTPAKPAISGKFKLDKCEVKVDYTNVVYTMSGDIEILPDQIRFDEIKLSDNPSKKTPSGSVNGNIFHNNFKDIRLDYDINFNKMLLLNTTSRENSTFFGKAYGTGNMGIYGFIDNVKLEINAKTEKGTQFSVALDGPESVADNGFIKFVSKDTIKKVEAQSSGFSLDMNLKATSEAEAQIIFDAKSGDVIRARGNGDLQLKINNLGKFDMFGEYIITSGDYLFTLENFITKKFGIEKGSSINWSGSPYNAEIDITASYKQRASIAPLFPGDSTGTYKRRYPVDCKLYMKNTLMQPDISFGIELPTIDENTRQKIRSAMLDESELNRQVFSLLLLKSFVTPVAFSGSGGISAGSAVAANSSEMLSNKISGWLNGLTKKVDIGVNYRPGGALSSDELDIALSKQLLNNRLLIDGNLGVNNNQNKNSSGLIGDVNVEYKLTGDGKFRVKGFNRSNDNTQITTSGGPFTQGVGAAYREEFETWEELYKRYTNKLRKPKKNKE